MASSVLPLSASLAGRAAAEEAAAERRAGALLTVDLAAIAANYRLLRAEAAPALCAAVVKADAYGLGAARVAPALWRAGCRHFFVALLDEGLALRRLLPPEAFIAVLNGPMPGSAADCLEAELTPVLNSPEQVREWSQLARQVQRRLPAILQLDSGMTRFGLDPAELESLLAEDALEPIELRFVMSHLCCADTPEHPANAAQLAAFRRLRARLPGVPASLAASSGIFLGPDYRFDLVRPGAALYGIAPQAGRPNPLQPVVRLQARVVQLREVPAGVAVGYGHTARTAAPARLATLALGYADGFLRGTDEAAAWRGETRLPLLGRVSMDSIVVDATAAPGLAPGELLDLLGPRQDLDALARQAGTIGYELLTRLGSRFHRRYSGL